MAKKLKKSRVRAAPVQELIIKAIAGDYPNILHDRESFLCSGALKEALEAARNDDNSTPAAVKKSLSRAKNGAVREVLVPARNHPRVMLPEIGMVAISVSIASLNVERELWLETHGKDWQTAHRNWKKTMAGHEPHPMSPEPTQELILQRIIENARKWIDQELLHNSPGGGLRLLVLDASIVHGSGSFDMLLTVLYREVAHFTRFVREVVQRTQHVDSTQTLQVPFRIGFPALG